MTDKDDEMFLELQQVEAERRRTRKEFDEHPINSLPGCAEFIGTSSELGQLGRKLHELSLRAYELRKKLQAASSSNVIRLEDFRRKP